MKEEEEKGERSGVSTSVLWLVRCCQYVNRHLWSLTVAIPIVIDVSILLLFFISTTLLCSAHIVEFLSIPLMKSRLRKLSHSLSLALCPPFSLTRVIFFLFVLLERSFKNFSFSFFFTSHVVIQCKSWFLLEGEEQVEGHIDTTMIIFRCWHQVTRTNERTTMSFKTVRWTFSSSNELRRSLRLNTLALIHDIDIQHK